MVEQKVVVLRTWVRFPPYTPNKNYYGGADLPAYSLLNSDIRNVTNWDGLPMNFLEPCIEANRLQNWKGAKLYAEVAL